MSVLDSHLRLYRALQPVQQVPLRSFSRSLLFYPQKRDLTSKFQTAQPVKPQPEEAKPQIPEFIHHPSSKSIHVRNMPYKAPRTRSWHLVRPSDHKGHYSICNFTETEVRRGCVPNRGRYRSQSLWSPFWISVRTWPLQSGGAHKASTIVTTLESHSPGLITALKSVTLLPISLRNSARHAYLRFVPFMPIAPNGLYDLSTNTSASKQLWDLSYSQD